MNKVDLYVRLTGIAVDADGTFCTCFAPELSVIAVFASFVMLQPPYENVVQRD